MVGAGESYKPIIEMFDEVPLVNDLYKIINYRNTTTGKARNTIGLGLQNPDCHASFCGFGFYELQIRELVGSLIAVEIAPTWLCPGWRQPASAPGWLPGHRDSTSRVR